MKKLTFLMGLCMSTGSVWAQPKSLDDITVSGRKVSEDWSTVGNSSVVDQNTIKRVGHTHSNELLVRAPGTWISRGSGQEHLTAIRSPVLTGPGACGAFLYLSDGVPIRPAGFCNINNLFELNTEQASAIEVVRGPSSALYGGNALNGLINVISPRIERQTQGAVALDGGPNDYTGGEFSFNVATDKQGFRVDFNGVNTGDYRAKAGFDQQKINLRHEYIGANWLIDTIITGTNLNQETAGFVPGFDAYRKQDLRRNNPNPEAFRDAFSLRVSSEFSRNLANNLGVSIIPYYRRSQLDFLQHFLPGQPLEQNGQDSFGAITTFTYNLANGSEFKLGANIEYADIFLREDQAGPVVNGSAFLVATRPQGLHYDYSVVSKSAALFFNGAWQVNDRLKLVNSLRHEVVLYDYTNKTLVGNTREDGSACGFGGCLFTRPEDRNDRFRNTAARLGFSYALTENMSSYASVGLGFRPPQTTELYRLQSGQAVADLKSERIKSFEIGFRGRLIEGFFQGLSFDILGFAQRKTNFIFRDSNGLNISDGKTRSYGFEFDLNWQMSERHAVAFNGTLARHRYAFNTSPDRNEVIKSGKEIDTAPPRIGSIRYLYTPNPIWTIELEGVYQGKYFIEPTNEHRYNGHQLFNARVSYLPNPKWRITLRANNVLDKKYADRADFAFGSFRYFPGTPRQVFFTTEYNF